MRTCTDGNVTNKYEKKHCKKKIKNPYKDQSHDCSTSCFGKTVASDEIPYIVVPPSKKKYRFCSGVIINRNNGNYLYCVVAEVGPKGKGMGEVSIYAAWRMRGWKAPNKNKKVPDKKKIGERSTEGSWKIILFDKSEPNRKAKYSKFGWKYKKTSSLRKQIKKIGKKYYKGGRRGKCLN